VSGHPKERDSAGVRRRHAPSPEATWESIDWLLEDTREMQKKVMCALCGTRRRVTDARLGVPTVTGPWTNPDRRGLPRKGWQQWGRAHMYPVEAWFCEDDCWPKVSEGIAP
jgi:hypothetical protein